MKNIMITSLDDNLEIKFSECITTKYCHYGIADFVCIKVEFKNITDQKEYVYIDSESEVCYIKLDNEIIIKMKQSFQNIYKKAIKKNITLRKYYDKSIADLTLMEDDTNLYLVVIDNNLYLKIDTFIGNIIQDVNIFPREMEKGYNLIFNFLNK